MPALSRSARAKILFDDTVTKYHLPSAEATGVKRTELLAQAAAGYERVINQFSDQLDHVVPATRSLANVYVEQGRVDDALKLYRRIGVKYSDHEWEVLQAWKSAADVLWDADRPEESAEFDRLIVEKFDHADSPQVYRTIVNASKRRLAGKAADNREP